MAAKLSKRERVTAACARDISRVCCLQFHSDRLKPRTRQKVQSTGRRSRFSASCFCCNWNRKWVFRGRPANVSNPHASNLNFWTFLTRSKLSLTFAHSPIRLMCMFFWGLWDKCGFVQCQTAVLPPTSSTHPLTHGEHAHQGSTNTCACCHCRTRSVVSGNYRMRNELITGKNVPKRPFYCVVSETSGS